MNDFWGAVLIFIAANWWWLLILFFMVGGTILEFLGDTFSAMFKALGRRQRLKNQIRSLKRELAAKNQELERAHKLLGSHRPLALPPLGAEARMARLLDRVQATDSAMPQLPQNLRDEIDNELTRFYAVDKEGS